MLYLKKLITTAAMAFASTHAGAAVLTFQSTAAAGGGTDVAVLIAGVTDLYAYDFTVDYDASLLSLTGMTPGSFLGAGAYQDVAGYDVEHAGQIFYAFGVLSGPVAGISGSGTLMSFHFDTLATGVSALTFSNVDFSDSVGRVIASSFVNSSLAVTVAAAAVPEPTSALLLGIGAVALLARRRGAFAPKLAA